jgi:hypothetical protein
MGDNLAMPGYGDILALFGLADKLGELVFRLRDGIRGHSTSLMHSGYQWPK